MSLGNRTMDSAEKTLRIVPGSRRSDMRRPEAPRLRLQWEHRDQGPFLSATQHSEARRTLDDGVASGREAKRTPGRGDGNTAPSRTLHPAEHCSQQTRAQEKNMKLSSKV